MLKQFKVKHVKPKYLVFAVPSHQYQNRHHQKKKTRIIDASSQQQFVKKKPLECNLISPVATKEKEPEPIPRIVSAGSFCDITTAAPLLNNDTKEHQTAVRCLSNISSIGSEYFAAPPSRAASREFFASLEPIQTVNPASESPFASGHDSNEFFFEFLEKQCCCTVLTDDCARSFELLVNQDLTSHLLSTTSSTHKFNDINSIASEFFTDDTVPFM
mmetsp:Transcript_7661/g.9289  ORF Transcript_7661/g.9289 Transcript_7661/m.9289 type:complete len:216 (-) Transcript_7661:1768-2415(-)